MWRQAFTYSFVKETKLCGVTCFRIIFTMNCSVALDAAIAISQFIHVNQRHTGGSRIAIHKKVQCVNCDMNVPIKYIDSDMLPACYPARFRPHWRLNGTLVIPQNQINPGVNWVNFDTGHQEENRCEVSIIHWPHGGLKQRSTRFSSSLHPWHDCKEWWLASRDVRLFVWRRQK